jgi:hypothetical protein
MAILSDTTMNCWRPVIGFVAHPATQAKSARHSKDLSEFGIAPDFKAF